MHLPWSPEEPTIDPCLDPLASAPDPTLPGAKSICGKWMHVNFGLKSIYDWSLGLLSESKESEKGDW